MSSTAPTTETPAAATGNTRARSPVKQAPVTQPQVAEPAAAVSSGTRARSPPKQRPVAQEQQVAPSASVPSYDEFADLSGKDGTTGGRTAGKHAMLAERAPKPVVTAGGTLFNSYRPSGMKVSYADNKVGIMPGLEATLMEIAEAAALDVSDPDTMSQFLEALVTDVYVNPYSDKQTFDGQLVVGSFTFDRRIIAQVIQPKVGTMHRRFARAMAPLVVQVMHDNYEVFGDILDKRCSELNLSTRAEAVRQFDGADALTVVDRETAKRAAEAKFLALSVRPTGRAYSTGTSAASMGLHDE